MIATIVKLETYKIAHNVQRHILDLVLHQIDVIVLPDTKTSQFQFV
jgi:hypothetical protein